MDSTKDTPSSSSSLQPSGSFLIRAPLTVDSDSETASSIGGGSSSFNSFENNSELDLSEEGEGFLSGNDEFDTVSERGISLEQDENGNNNGGFSESFKLSNQVVVPIARMSIDDFEVFDEMSSDEEIVTEVEDEGFSGVVKVPPGSIEISTLDEGVKPLADKRISPESPGEERVESENVEEIGSVDEVAVFDMKELSDAEESGEERVELELENGSVMFNDDSIRDVQPVMESVGEVDVFDVKELSDVEKSGEERVELEHENGSVMFNDEVQAVVESFDEVDVFDVKELSDVEKSGEERVELEHEHGAVMFNDPNYDVQPVVESVDEVVVFDFDMKEMSDVEKSGEERVELEHEHGAVMFNDDSSRDVQPVVESVDEVVVFDMKESSDVEKSSEERVELKDGNGHEMEENGSVMFNDDSSRNVQPVVESVDEVVFDMKELSNVEKSGEERVELESENGHEIEENGSVMFNDPNHDVQPVVESVDEVAVFDMKESSDVEKSGEERVESKDGIGHEIEENGSVMFNDPNHDVQPVVESVDEVAVFDMNEPNDVESVDEVSAPRSILDQNVKPGVEDIAEHDDDVVQLMFGTQHVASEVDSEDRLEGASQRIIVESDEEGEAEREYEAKELLDSAALAALLGAAEGDEETETEREYEAKELLDSSALASLLKASAGAGSDGVGSRVFDLSKVTPLSNTDDKASKGNISDEDRQRFEKLQLIRVKFLRLVQRLGHSHTDPMVAQVLYRLALAAGSLFSREFSLESAKRAAMQLEAEGKDDLDFSLNIVVLGKTGVGKSASINSILCEQKSKIDAFEPATTAVKEIVGTVDGVKMRIFDTPGLRSPVTEEAMNRKLLASMKRFIKKFPPDLVLYVDRLDAHDKDLTDCILLKSLTDSLGSSIWQNAIVTLTHAASASPEGPFAEPLSFEVFVAQRSHVIHRAISQAVGDLRLMNPSMMHPVALVENHPSCERDGKGEILLPNGQTWRSQLLLLCYSVKILSEASSLSRPREYFDNQKLFGFRTRSPPLPYLLSTLLQSRPHPKLPNNEGGEDVDLDTELGDSTYSDEEDHDEYDQLPPFKPLKRSQVDKLSKQQRTAYYEEYDYRIKLLQKKQWREEVKRMRGKGKDADSDDGKTEEADPATIPVALPDMILPPSFDGENPAYRYRFLDSASQLLIRPVLDSQSWDHDIGYDGVSLERSLAIAGYFPGAFAVQVTKDKREFNIHLDSSVCAKHGENGSTMAGFDIQAVGKQLAYVLRGETKLRNFEINQTTAGLSVTFLGECVATGVKVEDQIAVGKRLVLAGSAGAMRSQGDTAYGANIEVRLKDKDFPVEQNQTTFGLSLVKWRRDLGLMANLQSQFSIGRSSSMAIRVGLNNKRSGQISVKTSSSDQLHIALFSFIPIAASIFRMVYPGSDLGSSAY